MTFQALLVSKDEEAAGVLTPVLSRCGIAVSCCGYPEALCRLTEEKFDSVIVDFDDPHSASLVLQNASQAASGFKVVTVALLSDKTKVRNVFGAGANFILYKPISDEQAEASLRAAASLIKRERRRSFRVPVQVPIQLQVQNGPRARRHPSRSQRRWHGRACSPAALSLAQPSARSSIFPRALPKFKPAAKLPGQVPTDKPACALSIYRRAFASR